MDPSRAAEKWKKERMKQINEAEQRNETRKLALRNCEKDEKDSIRGFLFLSLSLSLLLGRRSKEQILQPLNK